MVNFHVFEIPFDCNYIESKRIKLDEEYNLQTTGILLSGELNRLLNFVITERFDGVKKQAL